MHSKYLLQTILRLANVIFIFLYLALLVISSSTDYCLILLVWYNTAQNCGLFITAVFNFKKKKFSS